MTRILLTNDDGLHAEGIAVARAILDKVGEVTTVVPDREMSGASHSLTLNHPLRVVDLGERVHVVNGTPTDCVNLALNRLLAERPDLVVSGINRGLNVGFDVSYSGTVAAAFEGALHGVRSLAVSIDPAGDLRADTVARLLSHVVMRILGDAPPRALFNLNIPAGEVRGVRLAVQGHSGYRTEIVEKHDPKGNPYYWIGGKHAHESELRSDSDIGALREGFAALTPLSLDLTDHAAHAELKRSRLGAELQGWVPA